MKLNIFLRTLICTGMVFQSILLANGAQKKAKAISEIEGPYGYTFVVMVDAELAKVTKEIEKFIRTSLLKKSYKTVPANSYNMSIYSIYHHGNELIPLVKEWVDSKDQRISSVHFELAFEEQTNMANCLLEKFLNESLIIKYATLNFGKTMISLTIDFEEESWQKIRNLRKALAKVYENIDMSIPPIDEKLQIMLAYGTRKRLTVNELNNLNDLVTRFTGAKLMVPSIYLYINHNNIPVKKKYFIDCRVYS